MVSVCVMQILALDLHGKFPTKGCPTKGQSVKFLWQHDDFEQILMETRQVSCQLTPLAPLQLACRVMRKCQAESFGSQAPGSSAAPIPQLPQLLDAPGRLPQCWGFL